MSPSNKNIRKACIAALEGLVDKHGGRLDGASIMRLLDQKCNQCIETEGGLKSFSLKYLAESAGSIRFVTSKLGNTSMERSYEVSRASVGGVVLPPSATNFADDSMEMPPMVKKLRKALLKARQKQPETFDKEISFSDLRRLMDSCGVHFDVGELAGVAKDLGTDTSSPAFIVRKYCADIVTLTEIGNQAKKATKDGPANAYMAIASVVEKHGGRCDGGKVHELKEEHRQVIREAGGLKAFFEKHCPKDGDLELAIGPKTAMLQKRNKGLSKDAKQTKAKDVPNLLEHKESLQVESVKADPITMEAADRWLNLLKKHPELQRTERATMQDAYIQMQAKLCLKSTGAASFSRVAHFLRATGSEEYGTWSDFASGKLPAHVLASSSEALADEQEQDRQTGSSLDFSEEGPKATSGSEENVTGKDIGAENSPNNSGVDPWFSGGDPWGGAEKAMCTVELEVHTKLRPDATPSAQAHPLVSDPWHTSEGDPWQNCRHGWQQSRHTGSSRSRSQPISAQRKKTTPFTEHDYPLNPNSAWQECEKCDNPNGAGTAIDLEQLLVWLPLEYHALLVQEIASEESLGGSTSLAKLTVDIGSHVRAWFRGGWKTISNVCVSEENVHRMVDELVHGHITGNAKLYGIPHTLHRVAALHAPKGDICGLTVHVKHDGIGASTMIQGLLDKNCSILILGAAKTGKTTLLRDVARSFSTNAEDDVLVVDPGGEMGGLGSTVHRALGMARRAAWPQGSETISNFLETLIQEHSPKTIVLDEPDKLLNAAELKCFPLWNNSLKLVCSMQGSLEDLATDSRLGVQLEDIFAAAVVLPGTDFKSCRLVHNLRAAVPQILEGNPYEYDTSTFKEHEHFA